MTNDKKPEPMDIGPDFRPHVELYRDAQSQLESVRTDLVNQISSNIELKDFIHTIKSRIKSEKSLIDKLMRKFTQTGTMVQTERLFLDVNDIIGLRILHLHRAQIEELNAGILKWIAGYNYEKLEGPIAKVFDVETQKFFEDRGIATEQNERMYTSVHYVVLNSLHSPYSFEIQVRTLLEEEWGEIDHKINYPTPTDSIACSGQLRVLAHMTTGCNRLVDSILLSHKDHIGKTA